MKLSEFIALPEDHKRSIVMTEGVAVGKRQLHDRLVFIFQMHEYYVETFCCCVSKEVLEYRVFHSTDHLAPYLACISIDDLLN